jgi:uncharacterized protein YndB with AHSA1/START domain
MEGTTNREMRITHTLQAPIDLVWEVCTKPEHIPNWWGPNGFTCTIHTMDLKEGGEWKLTLHGPDGANYPNNSNYREIVAQRKIVFEHFNPNFIATILFEPKGEATQIDWTMLFDTAETRDTIVKVHKADEGQKQNIRKLEEYIAKLQGE